MKRRLIGVFLILPLFIFISSCQSATPIYIYLATATTTPSPLSPDSMSMPTSTASTTNEVPVTGPTAKPADVPPLPSTLVYDVTSAHKAAPYGDSYDLNRLERPFLQDMKYLPDVDIVSFNISEDSDWYYVSMQLNGNDPNNKMGIDYGVELDTNADGYGDTLIWAYPPYGTDWTTDWVQVYSDTNHDSAGKSSSKADNGGGNGYETLVFDGKSKHGTDPDLAWVRIQEGAQAVVQFAFKKSLTGPVFLVGVVADGGLKDVTRFDYNDHFTLADAGSPLKGNSYYPLKALFAVDNTCWQAYGMKNPYNVAKVCPAELSVTATAEPQQTAPAPGNSAPTTQAGAGATPASSPTSYP